MLNPVYFEQIYTHRNMLSLFLRGVSEQLAALRDANEGSRWPNTFAKDVPRKLKRRAQNSFSPWQTSEKDSATIFMDRLVEAGGKDIDAIRNGFMYPKDTTQFRKIIPVRAEGHCACHSIGLRAASNSPSIQSDGFPPSAQQQRA